MIKITLNYLLKYKFMTLVGIYFIGSTIIKSLTNVDICIPCIWKTLFGIHCPGCGLTRAFIHLLNFDLSKAFHSNWLIFLVLPIGLIYIGRDFYKFYKKQII